MSTSTAPHSETKLPSLLDDPSPPAAPERPPGAGAPASPSRAVMLGLGALVQRHRRFAIALAVLLAIGGGVGLYFVLRPTPQPDFLDDDLDLVLNYAWLTDDFNHLPAKERRELIADMIERMKNMPSGDSAMMAMFATTLTEKARAQMMKNVSRMAIDTWDEYAVKYDSVGSEDRSEFLDETFVEFTKMVESMAGEPSNKSDEQRLEEVRRQAERDRKNVESGKFNPPAQALGRVFEFMNFEVGGHATPQQRTRGQLMMRDMMRHFRGEDVNAEPTPAKPAAPAGEGGGGGGEGGEGEGGKPPEPGPR